MKSNNSESTTNTSESNFTDYMQRGDDFYKIELLRQAKSWYEKALNLDLDNEMVKFRISECERKLAFENKVVYILISIGSILAVFYLIFYN